MSDSRLALLQLCDSLFPVGSFAHSDGLEAAVAGRQVVDGAGLRRWLEALLHLGLTRVDGPALGLAMRALLRDDLHAIAVVDDELYALRPASAGRDSTRAQGGRLLNTWLHVQPSSLLERAIAARPLHTFPVAFGIVCAAERLPIRDALEAFFYTRLAAGISAAMRLMPLGQLEAQKMLGELLQAVPACAAFVETAKPAPGAFAPLMDIAAMRQQYVHSRLFRS